MMRSLFTGVAGLRTHQTKMDVIGNNIANVNTTAYKSMSVTFRDLMYQTTQAASGPNPETGVGGVNARQIGLGVKTGAINTAITQQGAAQTTNNPFDIMLTGEAFFIVNNGVENFFTRDGSFYVDALGNLAMTSTGYNVMGWQVDPETGQPRADTVSPLRVMDENNMTYPAEATSQARITGIVDKNDTKVNSTSGRIMNLEFYDNKGYKYTAKFSVHSTGTEDNFYVALDDILDSNGVSVGDAVMANVVFGQTLQVDTAIPYDLVNGTAVPQGTVTYADAGGGAVGTQQTINQAIANPDAGFLNAVYGIDAATAAKIQEAKVDEKGNLVVTQHTGGTDVKSVYAPQTGVTATVNITGVQITPAGGAAVTLTPGTYNPGGGNPSDAQILQLYGLDLAAEQVVEYTINNDGSLTVTKKNVDNAANLVFDHATGSFQSIAGNGQGFMTLGLNGADNKFSDINIDFSALRNVNNNGSSTISATSGNTAGLGAGRKEGELIGLSVAQDGVITASYDNGMSKVIAQIATAVFANASGLEKQGDNLYSATPNSGEFDGVGVDIKASGAGYMQSGVLEMSNVDLSQEFTEMITTQRGFQANSRIITVSDTMLEELTNLKR